MRCLPAGRECAALAAMLVAVAAQVALLQRPRGLQISELEQWKTQARGVADRFEDAATLLQAADSTFQGRGAICNPLLIDVDAVVQEVSRARSISHPQRRSA